MANDDQRGVGFPSAWPVYGKAPHPPAPAGWVDRNVQSQNRWLPVLGEEQRAFAEAVAYAIATSIGTVEIAPHQDIPWRGEPFYVDAGVGIIIPGTDQGTNGSNAASAVSTASGAAYTDGSASSDAQITTFRVPDNNYAIVDRAYVWAGDHLGYRFVQFSLKTGGARSRALNVQSLPFKRTEGILVRKLVAPGTLIELLGTNTESEVPHIVRGALEGWVFPAAALADNLKALVQKASSV